MKTPFVPVLLCLFSIAILSCAPGTTSKEAPLTPAKPAPAARAESIQGKTITIIVSFAAGGGGDLRGRLYARYLPRYMPGNPLVVVRNMPGGGGTLGQNLVYRSKPDGLTVAATSGGTVVAQVLGLGGVEYDLLQMPAISGLASGGVFVIKSGIVQKVEDLPKAKGIIFGAAAGSNGWIGAAIIDLLGIQPDKAILAYGGSGDATRAFATGEINCTGESASSYPASVKPYVDKGEVMALFQYGLLDSKGDLVRERTLPDMPTTAEVYQKIYGKPPSGVAWEAYKGLIAIGWNYKGVLQLPPGVPDNIVRLYRDAAEKMSKDADFSKDLGKLEGEGSQLQHGEAYEQGFKKNLKMDPQARAWLQDLLAKKYGVAMQ